MLRVTQDARVRVTIALNGRQVSGWAEARTLLCDFLRHELGRRLRLRYAPELDLRIDHSLAHADRVAAILRDLPPPATD